MATAPVKSQPLHNFSLPFLKWGGTAKNYANSHHRFRRPTPSEHQLPPSPEPHRFGSRTSRNDRFGLPPSSHKQEETDDPAAEESEAGDTVQKPWNLRPRKPVGPVVSIGRNSSNGEVQEPVHWVSEKSTMQCGTDRKKEKKSKFWIALSKDEIEEDIFVMTGSRPARRPKKRPKIVQKQVDSVFPGLWLVGVTADAYRLADTPPKR